jgi:hypothetical protein
MWVSIGEFLSPNIMNVVKTLLGDRCSVKVQNDDSVGSGPERVNVIGF